jgi:hypothetical protein
MQPSSIRIEAWRHSARQRGHHADPPNSWQGSYYQRLGAWLRYHRADLDTWLSDYYQGMLRPFRLEVDEDRLKQTMKNDFMTMATSVLHSLRLFLMAHQTMDSCFPFQSTTTMLCREFGITAPALALSEREQSSPYIALKILSTALSQESFAGSALLVVLDLATLPFKGLWEPDQKVDTALAVKLTKSSGGASLHTGHFWMDTADRASWSMDCIHTYLASHGIGVWRRPFGHGRPPQSHGIGERTVGPGPRRRCALYVVRGAARDRRTDEPGVGRRAARSPWRRRSFVPVFVPASQRQLR